MSLSLYEKGRLNIFTRQDTGNLARDAKESGE